jgi:hypothetical protein
MFVNTVLYMENDKQNGNVFFGKYRIDDILITKAINNTRFDCTGLDVYLNRCYITGVVLDYEMCPKGTIKCGCCKETKEVSKKQLCYVVYNRQSSDSTNMIMYNSLICFICRSKIGDKVDGKLVHIRPVLLEGSPIYHLRDEAFGNNNFIVKRFVRRWRKKTYENKKIKLALATLTYPIMHWACKLNGPLYRLALKRNINSFLV